MLTSATIPPARRPELVLRSLAHIGQHVIKDPSAHAYYSLGEQESFLLAQLDGTQTRDAIRQAFESQFAEPLPDNDLDDFLHVAAARGLLQSPDTTSASTKCKSCLPNAAAGGLAPPPPATAPIGAEAVSSLPGRFLNVLYWRRCLFDPDRFFGWLEPKLWWLWTSTFMMISASCIATAAVLAYANHQELVTTFGQALRWETALAVWLTLLLVTTCHEFAHGLTCKHHGGEVHEVGFLLLFFMPCLYCNVSDAWLLPEKSKRLAVTFAGGYCDLVLWALAVFVWRLTPPDLLVNFLAWVVLTICGGRIFFNFNPLLKLDGYYLLSDLAEIPNLQQRAHDYLKGQLRWLLWGAARPGSVKRGKFLVGYGLASWLFGILFLTLILVAVVAAMNASGGSMAAIAVVPFGGVGLYGLCRGFLGGEVRTMIRTRRGRTMMWALALAALPPGLFLVEREDRASGPCQLRSATRAELHAPVTGFLERVLCDEGQRVSIGQPVAKLEVPHLANRVAQKQAEIREGQARLRLLEVGPRVEEIDAQRRRVERAQMWRELAQRDLERARRALEADLARLDQQIAQYRAELDFAQDARARSGTLRNKGAVSAQQHLEMDKKNRVTKAQVDQALAQRRAQQAVGTRDAETELARRQKELAEAQATLALLEAGTRVEEVDAERARLDRLYEEQRYLAELQKKQLIVSRVAGVVTTPRFRDSVGRYYREGELLCVIEDPAVLEVDVGVSEKEIVRVQAGQAVELKVHGLPLETIAAIVHRVAPRAEPGAVQSSVAVYCRLETSNRDLRAGMMGHARIYTGPRPVGQIVIDRTLRFLRAEFW